jgi:glutathione synthase
MVKIVFVMDPLETLNPKIDGTVVMIEAAINQGWEVFVTKDTDLCVQKSIAFSTVQSVSLSLAQDPWFSLKDARFCRLNEFDIIMMRKEPPFDMDYIFATYALELAERDGCLVANKPQSLRDANEKFFIMQFPQCITDTIVSADLPQIQTFFDRHQDIVVKPLDAMGGRSVHRLQAFDDRATDILREMTHSGQRMIMAQRCLPEVMNVGDKRILLINGKPAPYAYARFPKPGDFRANLAVGGGASAVLLTERDKWLCAQVEKTLQKMGLFFVGLDVIGDYITEINVTCPTCIRQLNDEAGLTIAKDLLEFLSSQLVRSC